MLIAGIFLLIFLVVGIAASLAVNGKSLSQILDEDESERRRSQ